jgi:hypothetical protein
MACGGARPPAPAAPAPVASSAAVADAAPKRSDAALSAFLAPRPGEEPADKSQMEGMKPLDAADQALRDKCSAAKEKALQKTSKQDMSKQLAAAMKAMDKVSKRCMDLGLAEQTQSQALRKDERAQREMRVLGKGLAASSRSCGAGAQNPAPKMGVCFLGADAILWDREGWSCLDKALTKEDKDAFELGAAYVYSFKVDADVGAYEIVGRGCTMLLGTGDGNAETELVLRGKIGAPVDELVVYRRKPSP